MEEPTQEIIAEWKKNYGNVYRIALVDRDYYYRGLMRAEYKSIVKTSTPGTTMLTPVPDEALRTEEAIVMMATLWPEINDGNIQATLTGVITRLAEEIMNMSGYDVEAEPELL